jgi:L,D-transpeptidase catalytic domain
MRLWVAAAVAVGLLSAGVVAAAAAPAKWPSTMHAATYLHPGQRLVSVNGKYRASVEGTGRLVVRSASGRAVWTGPATGAKAYLYLSKTGQLAVKVAGRIRWETRTAGSGAHDILALHNNGVLDIRSGGAVVWSTVLRNGCPAAPGKAFVVDISSQAARMCRSGQQLRATRVTTGASALGDGTPTGTWHVQARVRDTTLYPAAGGAYPVKYWMPYDGAYGIHDSPWQTFAYGSSLYRTKGSHGCVHMPGAMMAWLYSWAPVGTRVTIHT